MNNDYCIFDFIVFEKYSTACKSNENNMTCKRAYSRQVVLADLYNGKQFKLSVYK